MAPSISLKPANPKWIFIGALIGSALLFSFSLISVIGLYDRQDSELLKYELNLLLKSNGKRLTSTQFREFVEDSNTSDSSLTFSILNTVTGEEFRLDSNQKSFQQCATSRYFQFDVTLCRHKIVPWPYLLLISVLYLLIVLIVMLALSRANNTVVRSFRQLFQTAELPYSEPLTFTKAWISAIHMAARFNELQRQSIDFGRAQALARVTAQLAHDIRSPLSALNMVSASLNEVSEEKREIIKSISRRINDIANGVLQKRSASTPPTLETISDKKLELPKLVELKKLIESLIFEKQLQFAMHSRVRIEGAFQSAEGAFARVYISDFSRAISNLMNNAVESLEENEGFVRIEFVAGDEYHFISIEDTGTGIPAEVLDRLGQEPFSSGKIGRGDAGSGLGFFQAQTAVHDSGGRIEVSSELGKGTKITIRLPSYRPSEV